VTEGRVEPEFDPGDPPHELPVKAGVEKGIVDRELRDILRIVAEPRMRVRRQRARSCSRVVRGLGMW